MKLHQRLFGTFATNSLHLLLVGNSISLAPGLVRLALGPQPGNWLEWLFKLLELLAVGLLGSVVVLEYLQLRTRADRRRLWDVPWPQLP